VSYDHHLRLLGVLVDLAAAELENRTGRVRPVALAADRGGAVYVADADRDRVLVFDFAGTFLREIGGFAARAGGFSGLSDLACAPRGALVTVERPRARAKRDAPADSLLGRSRVQWLDAGGRVTDARWLPAWSAGSAEMHVSVAVDDSNRVAVAGERSGEVFLLDVAGGVLAHLSGLAAPRALAFAPDGSLLVAEAGAGRVRRFARGPAPRSSP
jgi:DNA-binding beta-propeller fold protein YncE